MAKKLRHECERCGLAAEFERAGRFRDEDYRELFQEYQQLDFLYKLLIAKYIDHGRRIAQLARINDGLISSEPWPLI